MSKHLQQEVETLKKKLLALTATVNRAVEEAVRSIDERSAEIAQEVVDGDSDIDRSEVEIEEDCLKLLALYQPVATDLRFIIAVLKINNDIERVGDLAVNIAERALFLCTQPQIAMPFDFAEMRRKSVGMLRHSLEAFLRQDARLAHQVRAADDQVDAINREMYAKISASVRNNPDHVERLLSYLGVSRHLERIADYATNIAEDVIYLVEGEIVRHHPATESEGIPAPGNQ
jgi:phosphate transport system protein